MTTKGVGWKIPFGNDNKRGGMKTPIPFGMTTNPMTINPASEDETARAISSGKML